MTNTQADWGFLTPSVQGADGSYIGTLEDLSLDFGGSDRYPGTDGTFSDIPLRVSAPPCKVLYLPAITITTV